MSNSHSSRSPSEPEAKLRHEFVGMMFAVTIGEVGLQAAGLVQAGDLRRFLPAYGHLLLATVVVATSWVGWSASVAPGARKDVDHVFQWEFLVLLLDVFLVVIYFILVRTINFGKEGAPRTDPASIVARWMVVIFTFYLAWDLLTKVVISWRDGVTSKKEWREHFDQSWRRSTFVGKVQLVLQAVREHFDQSWRRSTGSRMVPTFACFFLACLTWRWVRTADRPHYLTADFSLLWLVLLFRVLKELVSAYFPSPLKHESQKRMSKKSAVWCSIACGLFLLAGIVWTAWSLPLPARIVAAIETGP